MKRFWRATGIASLMVLGSCEQIDTWLHPYDDAAIARIVPAPPVAAEIRLYPDGAGGVSIGARKGDCLKTACYLFKGGKWKPLQAADNHGESLMTVAPAIGSEYEESLWRSSGGSVNRVVVNTAAGAFNIATGLFDGPRIGLTDAKGRSYVTAYTLESGDFLKAHKLCTQGDASQDAHDPAKAGCAHRMAPNLYLQPTAVNIYAEGGKAWLVHQRADGSANVIDLFAAARAADPVQCLPGLILDAAPNAVPVETALSPDLFVSRPIDAQASAARRDALIRKCNPQV